MTFGSTRTECLHIIRGHQRTKKTWVSPLNRWLMLRWFEVSCSFYLHLQWGTSIDWRSCSCTWRVRIHYFDLSCCKSFERDSLLSENSETWSVEVSHDSGCICAASVMTVPVRLKPELHVKQRRLASWASQKRSEPWLFNPWQMCEPWP